MYFPLLLIFLHTYDQSHISYMATKSKEVTNNGIYYVLNYNRTSCGSWIKPTCSYKLHPAWVKSKGPLLMFLLGGHLTLCSLNKYEDITS